MKETRPIAAGHLEKVIDGADEPADRGAVVRHRAKQTIEAVRDRLGRKTGLILQNLGGAVHPTIGAADVRPERARALQAAREEPMQAVQQRRAQSPFCVTRARLAATASRQSCSRSPEAASGGRPSSVRALRIAAQ